MKKWGVYFQGSRDTKPGWVEVEMHPLYRPKLFDRCEDAVVWAEQVREAWSVKKDTVIVREYTEPLKRMTFAEAKRWVQANAERALYEATFSGKWEWTVQVFDGHNDIDNYSGRTLVDAVEAAIKSKEGR